MKKIFAHFVIGMLTRDYEKTTKIVNDIYNPKPSDVKKQVKVVEYNDKDDLDFFNGFFGSIETKPKLKKDEVNWVSTLSTK